MTMTKLVVRWSEKYVESKSVFSFCLPERQTVVQRSNKVLRWKCNWKVLTTILFLTIVKFWIQEVKRLKIWIGSKNWNRCQTLNIKPELFNVAGKKTIHLFLVNWIFQGKRIVAAADVRMLEVHVLGDGGEPSHWTHWTLQMGKCKGRSKHVHPNQYPQFPFCIHLLCFLSQCMCFFQTSECSWGGGGEAEVSAKPLFTSSTISPSPPLIYKQLTKKMKQMRKNWS